MRHPLLWHFSCGGPDAERLVAGRERIYLDRFWNEFAAEPAKIDEATRAHYAKLNYGAGAGGHSGWLCAWLPGNPSATMVIDQTRPRGVPPSVLEARG